MNLTQLVYTSEIVPTAFRSDRPLDAELETMLRLARLRNQENALTGLLTYSGGHFLQILEGQAATVDRVYGKIERDLRHRNVKLLLKTPIESRLFSKWSMGLLNLDQHRALDQQIFEKFLAGVGSCESDAQVASSLDQLISEFERLLDFNTPQSTPASAISHIGV